MQEGFPSTVPHGFQESLHDVIIIARKELTHCFRDSHVLIYTVMIPMILYPLSLVGLSEYMLWREGLSETKPIRVYFRKTGVEKIPELVAVAKKAKRLSIVETEQPEADLRGGKLECIIDGTDAPKKDIIVTMNPGSDRFMETKILVLTLSYDASTLALKETIKKSGQTPKIATVFDTTTKSVGTLGGKKNTLDNMEMTVFSTTVVLVGFYAYTLLIIAVGAIYPALAAFTEEAEKKTKFTTYLLPVERSAIVWGKFIAVSIMSLFSGLVNLLSMGAVALYFVTRMPFLQETFGFATKQFSLSNMLLLSLIFIISILLIASAYSLIAASAKSFKEAQNISSIVLVFVTILPMISILPGWTLNLQTALIPVLNMVLASKAIITDSIDPLTFVIGCLINLVIAGVFLYLAQIIFWGRDPSSPAIPETNQSGVSAR